MKSKASAALGVTAIVCNCAMGYLPALSADANAKIKMPAQEQGQANPAATDNIFSPPPDASGETPGFTNTKGKAEQLKEAFGADIPGFQQVRELPSLTPDQRKAIRELFNGNKQDVQPMGQRAKAILQQLKSRQQNGDNKDQNSNAAAAAPAAMPGSDNDSDIKEMSNSQLKNELLDLRTKIRSKRQAMWEEVKNILTPNQLQQFEQMRKGQWMPQAISDSP